MTRVVLSCEHAANRVPAAHREHFRGAAAVLRSHRGWDPGALQLARELARALEAPLVASRFTRLLADPNRSRRSPRLFSAYTRALPPAERSALLALDWEPHRAAVQRAVADALAAAPRVLHLSVHSFTPVLDGVPREVDVALLYDPARASERAVAARLLDELRARRPDLRLRRNAPYRGTADGLTTTLRRRFPARRYLGVELEVSQRFPLGPAAPWRSLKRDLRDVLRASLA